MVRVAPLVTLLQKNYTPLGLTVCSCFSVPGPKGTHLGSALDKVTGVCTLECETDLNGHPKETVIEDMKPPVSK